MDSTSQLHHELAQQLWDAERTGTPVASLSAGRPGLGIPDAYAIQRRGVELRIEAGERAVGRKVGLTSNAMQEQLGVDQPDFGVLLRSMMSPSGAVVEIDRLIEPRVEAEVAFVLEDDLAGPGVDREDVLAATAEVAPALEIIDSRIEGWRITIVDTIADNASSALAVLGARVPLTHVDLDAVGMSLLVGDERATGRGDAVLGHPAEPVAWLANELARYGESLAAGTVVLPGALARALPVARGQAAQADFGPLGRVSVEFV